MLEFLQKNRERIPVIGDMLFTTIIFPYTTPLAEKWLLNPEDPVLVFWISGLYLTMAFIHLFRVFRLGRKSRLVFISQLAYSAVFAACSAIPLILGLNSISNMILSLVFWGRLIIDRFISIIRRRRPFNIFCNVIAILIVFLAAFSSITEFSLLFVAVTASFSALVSILTVAFSQVQVGILKDIVRKTYASQIIVGMLLTMIAFSHVLIYFDESFPSFFDALWYCFAVVTTIGFGDFTPVSAIGRIITVILGIYGIIVVALITSIIVNFYGEMKRTDREDKADRSQSGLQ